MKLFFLLPGSFEHLFEFAGLHFNTNEFARELVDEFRCCIGKSERLWIAQGKIESFPMHGLVSCQSANVAHLFQTRRKPEIVDFFVKIASFRPKRCYKPLQTNSQQSTRCSRGQVDDRLGFFENFFDVLRHAARRLNPAAGRINKFFLAPKSYFLAICADLYRIFVWREELKKICWRSFHDSRAVRIPVDRQWSLVAHGNQLIDELTHNTAMRA